MSLSYDKAMQGYFGLYAATMSTVPDEYVPGERGRPKSEIKRARNRRAFSRTRSRRATRPGARLTDAPSRDRAASGARRRRSAPVLGQTLGDALTAAGFFARMVGLNFGLLVLGRTHFGVSEDAFSKQTIAFHVATLLPFGNIALNTTADWTKWVWQLQVVINIVLALWGAQTAGLLGGGAKPKRSTRKRA